MTKVLIVDDSKLMRITINKYLKKYDVDIIGDASDGDEAMELFTKSKPEIVTLDLTLPGKDGFQCLEEMIQKNPNVKILVISAIKDVKTRISLLNKGAYEFLTKPITEDGFTEAFCKMIH